MKMFKSLAITLIATFVALNCVSSLSVPPQGQAEGASQTITQQVQNSNTLNQQNLEAAKAVNNDKKATSTSRYLGGGIGGYEQPLLPSYQPQILEVPYQAPVQSYQAPVVSSYSAPSYSAPSYSAPSYSAPSYSAPSYSAPSYSAPSYQAPVQTYSNYSAPVYSPPVQSYSAPVQSYSAPVQSYSPPVVQTYEQPIVQTYQAPIVSSYSNYSTPSYSAPSYQAPVQSYQAPVVSSYSTPSYQAPVQTYSNYSVPSYSPPIEVPTYQAPVQSYQAPVQSYQAPVQSYQAPVQTYQQQSYVAPVQSYQAPVQTYQQQSYVAPVQTYSQQSYSAPVYQQPSYQAPIIQQSYQAPISTYGKRSLAHDAPYSLLVDHLAAASESKEIFTNVSSIECPDKPTGYTCPNVLSKEELKKKVCEYETFLSGTISLVPDTEKSQTRCGAMKIEKQQAKNEDESVEIAEKIAVILGKDCSQTKSLLDGQVKVNNKEVIVLAKAAMPKSTKYMVFDGSSVDLLDAQAISKDELSNLIKQCPKKGH